MFALKFDSSGTSSKPPRAIENIVSSAVMYVAHEDLPDDGKLATNGTLVLITKSTPATGIISLSSARPASIHFCPSRVNFSVSRTPLKVRSLARSDRMYGKFVTAFSGRASHFCLSPTVSIPVEFRLLHRLFCRRFLA